MLKTKKILAVAAAGFALGIGGTALAVGGPNESGNSGHFNPQSNPCQGTSNQPNCPGPH